ncbi:DUF554 domain-containing protein [Desulfofundulus sp. TPOSR]|uniref:DUF554 domain-containing protein n=1 Tax=Desulfofundulus kuznetsovii (strain DSM 6115 / VKM B-1805 / 17) TaxID=760568 RepID=A0AAU8PNQ7_DESK7|nr:DUF554 domain-containing protein [Desulfofundulus sp. TPOSR]AEG15567.1 protein of unknown function DUF554 [Desulfofundulus kuznetsovii DSM 6115]NHM27770.1 DUF554 domain-containing protein [Desulfofundulus sp. TPOSR]
MVGTLINAAAICAGALLGTLLKKGIPQRVGDTVIQGLGLAVILIGAQMALQTRNPLIVIGSLALGGVVGAGLDIEGRLESLGKRIEARFGRPGESGMAYAFVTASLIFCVGAMAVMGAIEDGLTGNPKTLIAKAMLDGIAATIFASTMGIGVLFSAVPVLIYQGSITLAARFVGAGLSPWVVAELTATGGLLIVAIGLNLIKAARIKVGNLLPAIFIAAIITAVIEMTRQY